MTRLESTIRKVIKPILAEHGFSYDGYLSFKKIIDGKAYIINFQKGKQGALTKEFTVNLAIYTSETYDGFEENPPSLENAKEVDCKYEWRARLGGISETWLSRITLQLFGARDKWWKTPSFADESEALLHDIGNQIVEEGIPWLEEIKTGRLR